MLVGKNASGMYVIDEDYKIISYNLAHVRSIRS